MSWLNYVNLIFCRMRRVPWLNAISCYLNLVDFLKLGLISFIKCCPPSIFMLGGDFNFLLSLLAKKFKSLNYQNIKHCL